MTSIGSHRQVPDDTSMKSSSSAISTPGVSFGEIKIREYVRVVVDHPDVRVGPPLALGWDYAENPTRTLDEYERSRQPKRQNLRLNPFVRRNVLINTFQIQRNDILKAELEVKRIRKQRIQTLRQVVFEETLNVQ